MTHANHKFTFKLISVLLLTIMLFAALGSASLLPSYAASLISAYTANGGKMFLQDYYTENEEYKFDSPEKKWDTMVDYVVTYGNYEMRLDARSGEVAIKDLRTGEILFSNPYDLTTVKDDGVKRQLLSQLVITYIETTVSSTTEKVMHSFNATWYDRIKGTSDAGASTDEAYTGQ